MHRRDLLAALPFMSLGACSVATTSNNTVGTLDVDRIVTDGDAILSACRAALLAPSVAVLLGTNYSVAQASLAAGQAVLTEIRAVTGPAVTVNVDTAKVQTLVTSLLADAQQVLTLVQGALGRVPGTISTQLQNYVDAALTLIPLVQVAAALAGMRTTVPVMTESTALRIANGG